MLFACHNQTRVSLCFFRVLSLFLTFVCSFRNCRDSSLSRCSIFKDHFTIPAPFFPSSIALKGASPDSLTILPHLLPFCQPLLKKKIFSLSFSPPSYLPPPSLLPLLAKNVTIFLTRLSKKADRTGHCRRMMEVQRHGKDKKRIGSAHRTEKISRQRKASDLPLRRTSSSRKDQRYHFDCESADSRLA